MPRVGPPTAGVVESEIEGCISLYHPESQEVSVLNQTASDVWRLSDGAYTLDQIVVLLARAYGVEPGSIREEVATTVDSFRAKQLFAGEGSS